LKIFVRGAEGIFASLSDLGLRDVEDTRSIILINRGLAAEGTFSSHEGARTTSCPGCIMVHEFLDHGLSWITGGVEGVEYHNKALRIKSSPERDGTDHENH